MKSLSELISIAKTDHVAIGHFNVSTLDGIWAVADAAFENKVPVIIGVSEGERDYVGVRQVAAIVKSIREERNQEIFLNADHTYSFDRVKEAVDAGFDAVIFDGAQLDLEENIRITKKCVEYVKSTGKDILIEGELGYIGTSSKILDEIPKGAAVGKNMLTKAEDAKRFVEETGVDLFAPAVGNIHGMVKGGNPHLDIEHIKDLSKTIGIPMVLHGGSGSSVDDLKNAVKAGMSIVHVNTELRVAYRGGLVRALSENPDEISPYKYLKPAKMAMEKVVEEKLRIIAEV